MGKLKRGEKSPKAGTKTEIVLGMIKFLIQPRTLKEIQQHFHISDRAVYRHLNTLKNTGICIHHDDNSLERRRYSIMDSSGKMISSIHFAEDDSGRVVKVVYFDDGGQQVIRWSQDTWAFKALTRRFLPK